jgi:hypothetical protein
MSLRKLKFDELKDGMRVKFNWKDEEPIHDGEICVENGNTYILHDADEFSAGYAPSDRRGHRLGWQLFNCDWTPVYADVTPEPAVAPEPAAVPETPETPEKKADDGPRIESYAWNGVIYLKDHIYPNHADFVTLNELRERVKLGEEAAELLRRHATLKW